jgi:hypothetical protein
MEGLLHSLAAPCSTVSSPRSVSPVFVWVRRCTPAAPSAAAGSAHNMLVIYHTVMPRRCILLSVCRGGCRSDGDYAWNEVFPAGPQHCQVWATVWRSSMRLDAGLLYARDGRVAVCLMLHQGC